MYFSPFGITFFLYPDPIPAILKGKGRWSQETFPLFRNFIEKFKISIKRKNKLDEVAFQNVFLHTCHRALNAIWWNSAQARLDTWYIVVGGMPPLLLHPFGRYILNQHTGKGVLCGGLISIHRASPPHIYYLQLKTDNRPIFHARRWRRWAKGVWVLGPRSSSLQLGGGWVVFELWNLFSFFFARRLGCLLWRKMSYIRVDAETVLYEAP